MAWTRRRRVLATLAVAALLVFSVPLAVYYVNPRPGPTGAQCAADPGLCLSMTLTVRAYHAGQSQPYATRVMPNDPIVDGFNKFLVDYFDRGSGQAALCPYAACAFIGNTGSTSCPAWGCGSFLEIGTTPGTSRADTALNAAYTPSGGIVQMQSTAENPQQPSGAVAATPATCNTGTTDSVTGISGSQPITGGVTIQEAGLFLESAYPASYMVSHDTISPGISASNGDTVTVAYAISLSNTGITTNFCNWFAGLMTGNMGATNHVTVSLTNTAGVTNSFYVWCTSGAGFHIWTTSCADPTQLAKIGIGTGTTPFTPASVALTAQVGSRTQVSGIGYLSPVMYWTSTITVGTTNTIGEVGMFLTLSANDYLFFATTLSPTQTETASTPYGQTLRLGD